MTTNKIMAKARVQAVVEIELPQPWGQDCNIGQLYDQSKREAKERLLIILADSKPPVRIIGETTVLGIITEEA